MHEENPHCTLNLLEYQGSFVAHWQPFQLETEQELTESLKPREREREREIEKKEKKLELEIEC